METVSRGALGNDLHGVLSPVTVGLARGPIVAALWAWAWRRGLLSEMRCSCAWVKAKVLWIKKKNPLKRIWKNRLKSTVWKFSIFCFLDGCFWITGSTSIPPPPPFPLELTWDQGGNGRSMLNCSCTGAFSPLPTSPFLQASFVTSDTGRHSQGLVYIFKKGVKMYRFINSVRTTWFIKDGLVRFYLLCTELCVIL